MIITADVTKFTPNAMHDNFGADGFAAYHETQLTVVAPADLRGRKLRILHDQELSAESPWRELRQRLRIQLDPASLEPGARIFAGAVQQLELVDDSGS